MKMKNSLLVIVISTLIIASSCGLSEGKIVNNNDEINMNNPIAAELPSVFVLKDDYYLYPGQYNNVLQIAEFDNPSNITTVAYYPTHQSSIIINLHVEDNLLIMTTVLNKEIGLEIVNITNILYPTYLGHYIANTSNGYEYMGTHEASRYEVQKQNDFCYLLANGVHHVNNDTIRIIDCSDLENLIESARYAPEFYSINDFAVKNEFLYVLSGDKQKIDIVNITDKSNPKKIKTWITNEKCYGIEFYQDYMFIYSDFNIIRMYNIIDPLSPVLINSYSRFTTEYDPFHDLVFWKHYFAGITIDFIFVYDINNLTSNQSISAFECLDEGYGDFLVGLYSKDLLYVLRASEHEERTLFVFDVSDVTSIIKIYPEGVADKIPLPSYVYITSFLATCVIIQRIKARKSKK